MLTINAGDNVEALPSEAAFRELQLALTAWGMMDAAMVGVGPGELSLGLDMLRDIASGVTVPLVCTNLDTASAGTDIIIPWTTADWAGRTILLTSVVTPGLLPDSSNVTLTSPEPALRQVRDAVPHDLLITVIHAGAAAAKDLLTNVQGIHVAVLGQGASRAFRNEKLDSLVVANNFKGNFLTWVDLDLQEGMAVQADSGRITLKDTIGEDAAILRLVDEYKRWARVRQDYLQSLEGIKRWEFMGMKSYTGADSCRWCHQQEFASWLETDHARALDTVADQDDPDCLSCHVTGMNDPQAMNGFISPDMTPGRANVQCEACHGPGSSHLLDPKTNSMAVPEVKDCLGCHTEKWSPDFNYYLYRYKGVHQ